MNPVLKRLVDKRIGANEQTHEVINVTHTQQNRDGSIAETDLMRLVPSISQGDSRDNRTGSKIKLTSVEVYGFLKFVPSGAANDSGYAVRLVCASAKEYPNAQQLFVDADATANRTDVADSWLRQGADPTSFNGTFERLHLPNNTANVVTHYDRIHYLVSDRVIFDNGSTDVDTRTSVRLVIKPFRIRLKVKNKILKYDDDTSTYPINFNPFLMLGFVNLENPGTTDNNLRVTISAQAKWRFKDM